MLDGGAISEEIRQHSNIHVAPMLPNGEAMSDDNLLSEFAMLESKDLDEYGKFTIENVMPMDYHFETGWLPEGSYVKSARFGGVDVLRQAFHPGDAGNTLEVVVASDCGSVAANCSRRKIQTGSRCSSCVGAGARA
jgi:hypothetical protein